MIWFIILLSSLTFSIPVVGEIWTRGKDNIIERSREELVELTQPHIQRAKKRMEQRIQKMAKKLEESTWQTILTWLLSELRQLALKVINRLFGK